MYWKTFKMWATSAVITALLAIVPQHEPVARAVSEVVTDANYSVSIVDLDSGAQLTYGDQAFDTASIVKVDILAALMSQREAAGAELSASEQVQAAAMIQQSDNAAATALFNAVGTKAGLEAFNQRIGLADTTIGSNGNWGLTQTTAADQITLLQIVFGEDSILTSESQDYVVELMSHVVAAQNFGVSAAADDPAETALKVGYLQRSATGLWDVTSIGRIEAEGHTYLIAVLSDGNQNFAQGVEAVNDIARAAVQDMTAI